MQPFTLRQITDALRISRARVEQWISRGYFRTPDQPVFGKPRDWDLGEAIRLALCAELVDASISPAQAGVLTQLTPHGFKNDTAFFVAWQGRHSMAGELKDSNSLKAHLPGNWYPKIIKGGDLRVFLDNPDVHFALVFNLDNLEHRVKRALGVTED